MADILTEITDKAAVLRLLDSLELGTSKEIDAEQLAAGLRQRIRGQDHVIHDIVNVITDEWAKDDRTKPIAVLLFVGPTGTGKTELSKALAAGLYGSEEFLLTFQCEQWQGDTALHRLTGAPSVYKGSAQGALTGPILINPRRCVLFDEIDKANPDVVRQLLLHLADEGKLTDQFSGKDVDFTQTVVVMTSNKEHEELTKLQQRLADPDELMDAVKKHLESAHAFAREFLARITRVCVFKPLPPLAQAEVVAMKMKVHAQQYRLQLQYVEPALIVDTVRDAIKASTYGMREVDRIVGRLVDRPFRLAKRAGLVHVHCAVQPDGTLGIVPYEPPPIRLTTPLEKGEAR